MSLLETGVEVAGAPPKFGLRNNLVSGAFVLLGAILFSAKAVMVKLSLPYGIDPVSLLLLRMLFALPFYAVILWASGDWRRPQPLLMKFWKQIVFLGLSGYYLASYFDFAGLKYISAGLERIILFTYPTLVLLISAWWLQRSVRVSQWIAIGLSYSGVVTAVSQQAATSQSENLWLGVGLIALSALTYAIFLIGSGELIPHMGVGLFTSAAMIVSTVGVAMHAAIHSPLTELWHHAWQVYAYAGAMAVFATVIPSFLISEGIKRVGAGNAAIIGGIGPVSTIILAAIFLGESFNAIQLLGTGLVIVGVIFISLNLKT